MNHNSSISAPNLELRSRSTSKRAALVGRSPPRVRSRNRLQSRSRCLLPKLHNMEERRCISEPEVCQIGTRPNRTGTRDIHSTANARFSRADQEKLSERFSTPNAFTTKLRIAQRSTSSKVVKKQLSDLKVACDCGAPAPENECAMLSELAVDAYYRVVIAKNKGISIICKAMNCYPENPSIQASCCDLLHLMAESHQDVINASDGVTLIMSALRNHLKSKQVQSVACMALREMSRSILSQASFVAGSNNKRKLNEASSTTTELPAAIQTLEESRNADVSCDKANMVGPKPLSRAVISVPDLIELLERAQTTSMSPSGRSSANLLLDVLGSSTGKKENRGNIKEKSSSVSLTESTRLDSASTKMPLPMIDFDS